MSDESSEDMPAAMSSAMPAQASERLLPIQEHAPEPQKQPVEDLMAVEGAVDLESLASHWPASLNSMIWHVQALDAKSKGTPMPNLPEASCPAPAEDITPIPPPLTMDPRLHSPTGTQAHEDADASVAGIGDSSASSDQDRDRLGAIRKSLPALWEASLPEAAPEPSEDWQDKSSSISALSSSISDRSDYAGRPTFDPGDVELYGGATSDTEGYAPKRVTHVHEWLRGPRAIAGTKLQLEKKPRQAEP